MWILLAFFVGITHAQELDLDVIKALEEKFPSYGIDRPDENEISKARQLRRFRPPGYIVREKKIQESDVAYGSVKGGVPIVRLSDNKMFTVPQSIYFKFYRLQDELGFKYLINKDGSSTFKINGDYVTPINDELALYEPPLHYTPATQIIAKPEFDRKLSLLPEVTILGGLVSGDYMKDLFNDEEASAGTTVQYGVNIFTKWDLPIKAGAAIHLEKTTYSLKSGEINYSAFSFGPQFKTKDFEIYDFTTRFQLQFRYSPQAQAIAKTPNGDISFKFNSYDLHTSAEHPIKNSWGEFVLGAFFQMQWLSLKDQTKAIDVSSSNNTNKAIGISFAQVFE